MGGKIAAFLPPPDHPNSKEAKEDAGRRQWQCLPTPGRRWNMTRGGGQRGRGEANRKRTTQLEGGGGGRLEASERQTTQQEGRCHDDRRWWNLPVRVFAYINTVAHQSPLLREKEGWGPIVVEAGEQSTTTVGANTLFHHGAARQRHFDPR